MQHNLSGIWNQCPMSHRRIPETARVGLIVSSVGSPGKYHQMCGRTITLQPAPARFSIEVAQDLSFRGSVVTIHCKFGSTKSAQPVNPQPLPIARGVANDNTTHFAHSR